MFYSGENNLQEPKGVESKPAAFKIQPQLHK